MVKHWMLREPMYLLKKGKFRSLCNYLWVLAFSRESGFAILDPLYRRFPSLVPYPRAIEVEVTTTCNLKCIMCEHTYWNEESKNMSFEDFKRIIEQFPKLKWIGVTGIGAGFLNKDYLKMLRYLKSKSIFVELFDTFYNISEKTSRELIDMGVNKIIVSMDAATKETYEKIRVGSDFYKVIGNIKKFIELKGEMKSPLPRLCFHYIISKLNINEIPAFIKLVHSMGGQDVAYILFTNILHKFEEIQDLVVSDISSEVKDVADKIANNLNMRIFWNPTITRDKPVSKCVNWAEPFIFVDGKVIPCCAINEMNRRPFERANGFGNIFEKQFKEIWNSKKYKNFRQMIHRGEAPVVCRYCAMYYTKSKDEERRLPPH